MGVVLNMAPAAALQMSISQELHFSNLLETATCLGHEMLGFGFRDRGVLLN